MACSDVVLYQDSYLGMPLHKTCLETAEARRLVEYGTPELGPTCQRCGRPVGVRDYPAVYPWDSDCECVPGPAEPVIVESCPVCGQRHELRICVVNEKSLLYRPNRPNRPQQPAKPKPRPVARERIAEPHAR